MVSETIYIDWSGYYRLIHLNACTNPSLFL